MYISLAMAHVNLSPGRFMQVVQKEKDERQQKAHAGYLQFYLFNHSTWDKLNCWGNWEIDKTSRELTSISEITEDVSPLWQGTRGRWDSHWDAKSTEHGWTALGILYCHVEERCIIVWKYGIGGCAPIIRVISYRLLLCQENKSLLSWNNIQYNKIINLQ